MDDLNALLTEFAPKEQHITFSAPEPVTKQQQQQEPTIEPIRLRPIDTIPRSDAILNQVSKQLEAINASKDVNESIRLIGELQGSINMTAARFQKQAEESALTEFQVPYLQSQLDFAMRADRSHRDWAKHPTDSNQTLRIRGELQQAQSAARASIKERLDSNVTYQGLMGSLKTMATLAASKINKDLSKEEAITAKANLWETRLGASGKERLNILFPEFKDNTAAAFSHISAMPNKTLGDDVDTVLRLPEDQIPKYALAGSRYARLYLYKTETAKLGDSAKKYLDDVFNIVDNDKAALEAMKAMRASGMYSKKKPEELNQQEMLLNPMLRKSTGVGDSKEDQAMVRNERVKIAMDYMTFITKTDMEKNIVNLNSNALTPAFLTEVAMDPARNFKGISLDEAIDIASQAKDKKLVQERLNQLVLYYQGAINNRNRSSLFTLPENYAEQVKSKAVIRQSMLDSLGAYFKGEAAQHWYQPFGAR